LSRPVIAGALLVAAAVLALLTRSCGHPNEPDAAAKYARHQVQQVLSLPDTATFRDERNGCGEVSYLSDSGVKVTRRRFIVLDSGHVLLRTADAPVEFALIWKSRCKS